MSHAYEGLRDAKFSIENDTFPLDIAVGPIHFPDDKDSWISVNGVRIEVLRGQRAVISYPGYVTIYPLERLAVVGGDPE